MRHKQYGEQSRFARSKKEKKQKIRHRATALFFTQLYSVLLYERKGHMISRKEAIRQYVKVNQGVRMLRTPVLTKERERDEKTSDDNSAIRALNRLLLVSSRGDSKRYS